MNDTMFLFEEIKREQLKYAARFPFTVSALIAQQNYETRSKKIYAEHFLKLMSTPNVKLTGWRAFAPVRVECRVGLLFIHSVSTYAGHEPFSLW